MVKRTGPRKYYKGQYFIVFYDKTGENFEYMFSNVREILKFMKKEINRQNIQHINKMLYSALKTDTHFVKFLTGKVQTVYIIDILDEERNNEDD